MEVGARGGWAVGPWQAVMGAGESWDTGYRGKLGDLAASLGSFLSPGVP